MKSEGNMKDETNAMKQGFNNVTMVRVVNKYKWSILAITVASAILGIIFSSSKFITPKFKSEALAYPANISTYSNENETEQMLQIVNSQAVKDSIIEKYDLWKHYNLSRDYKYAKSTMMYYYSQNVKVTKTPYDAVSVVVMDKNPDTAALIAKDILVTYDKVKFAMNRDKYIETATMLHDQIARKQHDIDSMKTRFSELSQQYNLFDYKAQSREVSKSYLAGSSKANEMRENLQKYGAEMIELKQKIELESKSLIEVKLDYETEYRYIDSPRSFYSMVSEPYPDDHKSYPVRWVIVALCAFGAMVLSILVAFVIERRKKDA